MKNIKVIKILKTFSKQEIKEFRKFIDSPFFNPGRDLIPLYDVLIKYYPGFNKKNFNNETVFKKLFPERKFDSRAYHLIAMLYSTLAKTAEQYLFFRGIKKNNPEYYKILSNEEIERELYDSARKNINKGLNEIEKRRIDTAYFEMSQMFYQLADSIHRRTNENKEAVECEKKMEKSFVLYFTSRAAEIIELMNHYKLILNINYEPNAILNLLSYINIDELLMYLKKNKFKESSLLKMYLYITILQLNKNNEDIYRKLRKLHKILLKQLSDDENYKIFLILEAVADNLRDIDNRKYLREILDIYKDQMGNNIYKQTSETYMHIYLYRSIAVVAVQMNEMKWAEKFIYEYSSKLVPDQRDSAFCFAMAYLLFYKKDYSESLNFLNKLNYEVFQYKFDYKILLMQIYYELDYTEELLYSIDSIKHFLKENLQVSDMNRIWILNFIGFLNELIRLKSKPDTIEYKNLRNRIISTNEVNCKSWLIEKTEETKI